MFTNPSFSSRAPLQPYNHPRSSVPPTQPVFTGHKTNPNDLFEVKMMMMDEHPLVIARDVVPHTDSPEVIQYVAERVVQSQKSIDAAIFPTNGATLLHSVVSRGNPKVVEALLKMGANPAVPDKKGQTAFDWLERTRDRLSQKNIQAIQKLLMAQLLELAKPKIEEAPPSSSWLSWPFGGTTAAASSTKEAPLPMGSESKIMAHADTQTDPLPQSNARELELAKSLETLRLSAKTTQRQLSESLRKLASQETKFKDAIEKDKQLQRLQKENKGLQVKLQKQLETMRTEASQFETRLSQSEAFKAQSAQSVQAEIAQLKAENTQIKLALKTYSEQTQGVQAKLDAALLQIAEKDQAGKQQQQTSSDQLKTLKVENEKLNTVLRKQNQKAAEKLAESENSRVLIQQTVQAQSTQQKEALDRLHKDLVAQRASTKVLQANLNEQIAVLTIEKDSLKATFTAKLSQSDLHKQAQLAEFEKNLIALQLENRQLVQNATQFKQNMQLHSQSLEERIQAEEQKNRQLQDHLVSEKARRMEIEIRSKGQADILLADNRQMMTQLSQFQGLQERLAAAEQSNRALADQLNQQGWHLHHTSQAHEALKVHSQQKEAELGQAHDRHRDLLAHNARLQKETDQHNSIIERMLEALHQSSDLNDIRAKVGGMQLNQYRLEQQPDAEKLVEEPQVNSSNLMDALNLEHPNFFKHSEQKATQSGVAEVP